MNFRYQSSVIVSKKTKRKKQKKSVKSVSEFKEFYHSLQVPIIVLSGIDKITYMNIAAEDLLGGSLDDYAFRSIKNLFKGDDLKKVQASFDVLSVNDGEAEQSLTDLIALKKNGRRIHVDFSIKKIEINRSKHQLVTLHNLTEVIKLQNEKDAIQKEIHHMTKLADIGRLTAGVAHELNNPLMIIQGFAENIQLLTEQKELDKNELLLQIDPIVKASDRMAKIISTMMKLSRDDEVYLVQVDLIEVIEDALMLVRNTLKEFNVELEKQIKPNVGIVKCDPSQIEQIILNVMNNAIQAITVNAMNARKIKISLLKDEHVRLKIWNNGPPIPAGINDKIMTPFFTTKEVGEGTGLGLSLSYSIMKAHNGDISFQSTKEFGTEFSLNFPLIQDVANFSTQKPQRKFLVVDDEEFIRDLMQHKLERYGYKVLTAHDGLEALKILEKEREIECVFSDIRMPNMDGIQLIKQIKSANPNVLIYVISGYGGKKALELRVRRLGVNGFLMKPIDHLIFSKIINEIEEHLNFIQGQGIYRIGS